MPVASSALSVTPAAGRREEPDLVGRLRETDGTTVVCVRGDGVLTDDAGRPRLVAPDAVPDAARVGFLGERIDGAAVLVAAVPQAAASPDAAGASLAPRYRPVRAVAGLLGVDAARSVFTAVALGRFLTDARFCPRCGAETRLERAGWSRRCPRCGAEHFPRNDPAVIMLVTADDRPGQTLLGSNVLWGPGRYSLFAGFVEAGEPAERAVVRELREEAGVEALDARYLSSQPWPYPHSLMLGFHVRIADGSTARADGTEIAALRWFDRAEIGEALRRGGWEASPTPDVFTLPGEASIARALIRRWYEGGL